MNKSIIKYNEGNENTGIVKGAVSLTVAMLFVKLLGLIYKIPLSYILGDEGMGYFNSAYTVYTFFFLICNAGVPKAITVLIADSAAKGRRFDEGRIFTTALRTFALVGLMLSLLFGSLAEVISNFIGNSRACIGMVAVAPSVLFIAISGVMRGYLNGRARLAPIAVSQLVEGVFKLALGLLLAMLGVRLGLSLEWICALAILGVTLSSFLGLAYLSFEIKTENKNNKIEQNCENVMKNGEIIKRILKVAVPITLAAAVMSITNLIDLSIVMRRLRDIGYSEAEAGALYGNYTTLAVPMFNLMATLVSPIAMALLPLLAKAHALKDSEGFNRVLKNGMEICAFLSVPCAIGFMVFSEEILALLFDDVSAHTAAPLLVLLAPAVIFMVALTVINTALEASGMVNAALASMSVGAISKIFVSGALVGSADYGISGAPIGTTVFYAVAFLVSVCMLLFKGKFVFSVFGVFLRPIINASLAISLVKLLTSYLKNVQNAQMNTFIIIGYCAILYMLFSFLTGGLGVFSGKKLSKYTKSVDKC